MTARTQRLSELIRARDILDARIAAMGGHAPVTPRGVQLTVEEGRDMARAMVWSGSTHAEIGRALRMHVDAVGALIAGPAGLA